MCGKENPDREGGDGRYEARQDYKPVHVVDRPSPHLRSGFTIRRFLLILGAAMPIILVAMIRQSYSPILMNLAGLELR